MSTVIALRPYQVEAFEAVNDAWKRGMMRPAVVLPTGAGKTVVFAQIIIAWLKLNPGKRALVIAHRIELVSQAQERLLDVSDDLEVGIVQGTTNETLAPVICAMVQTLRSVNRRRMIRDVGLIVVDECHHATAASYRMLVEHWPAAVFVGFTATMSRSDNANLGDVWEDVVYMREISEMIRDGYLVRPRGIRVYVDSLDMSGVRKSGGDYRESDLDRAIQGSLAPEAIAEAIRGHSPTGQTVVFAPGVESAKVIHDAILAEGFTSAIVYDGVGDAARRDALVGFRQGRYHVLVNCMILTEGTDLPMISTVVIARPTLHPGLYIQMAGRGLRLYPGKDECLIIDVVGASQKHSLTAPVELYGMDEKDPIDKDDTEEEQLLEDDVFGEGMEPEEYVRGPLSHAEVDLFHGSKSAWMRTYGGIWFLAAGERYIAIIPGAEPGTYDVVSMHKTRLNTGQWIKRGLKDIAWAMVRGEQNVTPNERMTALKDRGWRMKTPSQKMIDACARARIVISPEMSAGEVSKLMTERFASSRIDPPLMMWGK